MGILDVIYLEINFEGTCMINKVTRLDVIYLEIITFEGR